MHAAQPPLLRVGPPPEAAPAGLPPPAPLALPPHPPGGSLLLLLLIPLAAGCRLRTGGSRLPAAQRSTRGELHSSSCRGVPWGPCPLNVGAVVGQGKAAVQVRQLFAHTDCEQSQACMKCKCNYKTKCQNDCQCRESNSGLHGIEPIMSSTSQRGVRTTSPH